MQGTKPEKTEGKTELIEGENKRMGGETGFELNRTDPGSELNGMWLAGADEELTAGTEQTSAGGVGEAGAQIGAPQVSKQLALPSQKHLFLGAAAVCGETVGVQCLSAEDCSQLQRPRWQSVWEWCSVPLSRKQSQCC